CGISFPEVEPRMFSFNNPHGACPDCDGIGARLFFDPDLIVPDEELSLREGAIEPWERRGSAFYQVQLEALAAHLGFDMLAPWHALPAKARKAVLHGLGGAGARSDGAAGSAVNGGEGGEASEAVGAGPELELSIEKNGVKQTLKKEFEGVIPNL